VEVDHVSVDRWVLRFTPLLAEAARPCRHAVGQRWEVDETYVKVAGTWRYVYRAIDQSGQVIDVFVARQRDVKSARWFFERAIATTRIRPVEVVTDRRRHARRCSRSCCRQRGIAPSGLPTTGSRPTTAA
jgi:transposase-like protein